MSSAGTNDPAPTSLPLEPLARHRPQRRVHLYPCRELRTALAATPGLEAEVFALLQQIDTTGFVGAGRVHGGGLYKMEPKELAAIPAGPVLELSQAQPWRLGAE